MTHRERIKILKELKKMASFNYRWKTRTGWRVVKLGYKNLWKTYK